MMSRPEVAYKSLDPGMSGRKGSVEKVNLESRAKGGLMLKRRDKGDKAKMCDSTPSILAGSVKIGSKPLSNARHTDILIKSDVLLVNVQNETYHVSRASKRHVLRDVAQSPELCTVSYV